MANLAKAKVASGPGRGTSSTGTALLGYEVRAKSSQGSAVAQTDSARRERGLLLIAAAFLLAGTLTLVSLRSPILSLQSPTFGSTCHGAGRVMSRRKALKIIHGSELRHELEEQGIVVRAGSNKGLAEEAPAAYKDVSRVVEVVHGAGLARKVARLRPLGVIKG